MDQQQNHRSKTDSSHGYTRRPLQDVHARPQHPPIFRAAPEKPELISHQKSWRDVFATVITGTKELYRQMMAKPVAIKASRWFSRRASHTAFLAVAAVVVVGSTVLPIFTAHTQAANYDLSGAKSLLRPVSKDLQSKLQLDTKQQAWTFNASAAQQASTANSLDVGALTYSAQLPTSLNSSSGLTMTDTQSKMATTLKPQFAVHSGQAEQGRVVYPIVGSNAQLVYSFENDGVKEDIVLYQAPGDSAQFSYQLQLPNGMVARMQKDGSIGIYGGDPTLFGNISYGSDKDQAMVEKARQNSKKDHLYYAIPAPAITGNGTQKVHAKFLLQKDILTVDVSGLAGAHYPLSIDPSFIMNPTNCSWAAGSSDSSATYAGCQLGRNTLSGGALGSLTSASSLNQTAYGVRSVAYKGYMYLLSGRLGNGSRVSTVQYASIDASTGVLGAWHYTYESQDNGTTAAGGFVDQGFDWNVALYNGYIYIVGGMASNNSENNVQYAPINSNGTVGHWAAGLSMNTPRSNMGLQAYGGYIYAYGGCTAFNFTSICTAYSNTVESAQVRGDGSLSAWTAVAGSTMNSPRGYLGSVVYNGYLYALGGCANFNVSSCGSYLSSVEYAPITGAGQVGSWTTTASFITGRSDLGATVYNGYLYITGGQYSSTQLSDTQLAQVYANGRVGPWQSGPTLSTTLWGMATTAYNGYFYIAGGCKGAGTCAGNDVATVQYAKISTSPGGISPITTSPNTVNGIADAATVVYGDYLYLLGGNSSSTTNLNSVYYASLGSDGSVGTWGTTSVFADGRTGPAATAYNGYMYIVGGARTQTSATNCPPSGLVLYCKDIQKAPINSNGTLGTWVSAGATYTSTTSQYGRDGLGAAVYNGYMYVIGGNYNTNSNVSAEVDIAPINPDGTVGAWVQNVSALGLNGYSNFGLAQSGKYIYIVGGRSQLISSGATTNANSYVMYATLSGGGGMSAWASAGPDFTTARSAPGATVMNGYLYVSTGTTAANAANNQLGDVQYIKINQSDGTLSGSWTTSPVSFTARGFQETAMFNGYLYTIGGCSSISGVVCNTNSNNVEYAQVYNGGGGIAGTSGTTTVLSSSVAGSMAAAANGYVYSIGGATSPATSSTAQASVYYATASNDGTLGNWSPTANLNTARYDATVTVTGGYVYVLGGRNGSGTLSSGEYARISGNGSLGGWTQFSMSDARAAAASFALNGYLYIAGGTTDGTTGLSTVKYSQIGTNGAPGSWSSTTAGFTNARYGLRGFSSGNGTVYIMGGYDGTSYYNDVQLATPTGAGDITSWTPTVSFPFARTTFSSVVANGYVYVYSGTDASGARSDIFYAPIMSSGVLGNWNYAGTITGTAEYWGGSVSTGGFLYLLGGSPDGSGVTNTVNYVPLYGTAAVAHYSMLLTTDRPTTPANFFAVLTPQGSSSGISVGLASSSLVSPTLSSTSTTSGLASGIKYLLNSAAGANYYWIPITIDDSRSATFGEANGTTMSYFQLNYHPNAAMRLRGGKTFNANQLQSLDAQ